jgi:formylglycine-generating enzyme required for sulfatase activity/serine/threonine protein kinase
MAESAWISLTEPPDLVIVGDWFEALMGLDGAVIGQYQIVEQIGRGRMATVYKAYQPNLDRYVAVKVLAPDLAETKGFVARFEREAKAVARLRHRNILTVFDYGRQGDVFYLVMEYVSGGTLIERLGWPQELGYAVNVVYQVGDALAYAHRQGMIHRDVKPGNILMAEEDWPLLADFGLVKMAADSIELTASGASIGTPQYMSPEQAQGLVVDARSDIYCLGAVLYEAVTGQPPFRADTPMAVILMHINEPLTPPRTLRPDLPEELERVTLKALAKSPADRYQRMEEFLADLEEGYPLPASRSVAQRGGARVEPQKPPAAFGPAATPVVSSRPQRSRSSPWARVAIGLVLALTLGLVPLLFKAWTTPPAPISPTADAAAVVPSPPASPRGELVGELSPPPSRGEGAVAAPSPTAVPAGPVPQAIETRVWEADGVEMVLVPAGEYVMGSEELGDDERPAHRVYVDGFWIDRYEVTNERFARFVAATGYQTEAERRGGGWVWKGSEWGKVEGADWRHPHGPGSSIEGKMDRPVVLVSWNDAEAYCRWAGKRLPSEAEWEKAASWAEEQGSGGAGGRKRRYPWGDEFDADRCNTQESGIGDTTPVGTYSPGGDSACGAADMTGNVWEWVADWYGSDAYSQAPAANPTGPVTGTYKVLRGGAWPFDEVYARAAFRYSVRPDYTYDFAGFRCVSRHEP